MLAYPGIGEGTCPACRVGEENICDGPRSLGVYQDGGYSEMVLVPSYKYLVKLHGLDLNSSASLACSGLTAYTAVKKAESHPGQMVVVIGAGGLGRMAVQLAKATTNARIAIVDIDEKKLAEAKRLGADEIINSAAGDPVKGIKEVTDGLGADSH